ncbi:expressed unknown protein [Seminavis robusta]|uniref:Uncharacterized protein n=1 Tax=Seminavis robusta TaxID=568900 RepID=A0A9N8HIU2_9STRA|nr:expressed unknown protein [Seminavis robusta]|eukprot:Sro618_g176160.1 n/a (202) ;mRNA; f:3806-4411
MSKPGAVVLLVPWMSLVLLLLSRSVPVWSFQPTKPPIAFQHYLRTQQRQFFFRVHLSDPPNEDSNNEPATGSTPEKNTSAAAEEEPVNKIEPASESLSPLDWLSKVQTGFIYFFATAVAAGLLLNLFGYGYTLSPGEGLRIDSLNELRMEQQLDVASGNNAARGPGGLTGFFLRNPFTASLILTGIVLVYENVVYKNNNKK